jgi:hypothetical protein
VSIALDHVVLAAQRLSVLGALSVDHLRVLGDAVAVLRVDVGLGGLGLILRGSPCEVVTADLNVVVGELAELVVIHTQELSLLRGAQVKTRDLVDDESNDGGHDEGVGSAGDDVRNLDVQLLPVVVEPATGDDAGADTVKANDVIGSEEGVEDETDDTSDTVLSEHIHAVVNADPELDLGGEVGHDTGDDTEDDSSPRRNETGGGGGSDKTGDTARAPPDHGPLLRESVIQDAPGGSTEHSSQAGVPASHDGTEVSTECGTTVESEPSEPQKDRAESDQRDVVRAEVEHHLLLTLSKDPRVSERRKTGSDFDGSAAGVVEDTVLETPSVDVPYPASNWAVDERRPDYSCLLVCDGQIG